MTDAPRKKAGASVSQVLDGEESSPVENISPADPATKPGELNDDAPADNLKPDPDAAIDWLRWYEPEGPWVLTAILVDPPSKGRRTFTQTFGPKMEDNAHRWIDERNAGRVKHNVYFMVNRPFGPLDDRVAEKGVEEVPFLHADIDPKTGEDFAAGRRRIWKRLRDAPLPPSAIVDSGNGYQPYWRLDKSVYIGGNDDAIAETKAYNIYLRDQLGGDNCQDLSRILRLPGTINWPSAKKRGQGRVPRLASVVERHDDRVYPLAAFTPAPVSYESRGPADGAPHVQISENLPRIALDELPEAVTPRTRMLIVQGDDPDDPTRYGSRSEVVWAVVCEMVRAGCTDDQIAAIITDPDYGISAHVLAQKRSMEYPKRQIERAREANAEQWPMRDLTKAIEWMNARYFAALEGTDYTFFREDKDRVQPMKASGFHFELADKEVIVAGSSKDEKRYPISKLWCSDSRRRVYPRGLILDPSGNGDPHAYNLWRGFGVEPAPGDWSLMKKHVRDVLACGNVDHAAYIENWTAWSFQHPATPPRVAMVFRGGEGVGKGIFASNLVRAFGHHGLHVWSMQQVSGRFNSHLRHCAFLYADEVDAQDGNGSGALRGLITERTIPCEGKGKDLIQVDNHIHLVMASNEEWVVPAGKDARRYAVFDVSGEHSGDKTYFGNLANQMKNGGLAAMLHDMLAMDLTGFHPESDRPETDALGEQRAASLRGFERLMFDMLATGELPKLKSNTDHNGGYVFVSTTELKEYCQRWAKRDDISGNAVAGLLERLGAEKKDSVRPRGYMMLPLAKTRAIWDVEMFSFPWKPCEGWSFPVWRPHDDEDERPY